jgi:glucokinase
VDLGGTNVRVGAITPEGELLRWRLAAIQAAHGPGIGVQKISDLIDGIVDEISSPIAGVGIGSTGPLDRQRGCIQNPYTLPGWENVDILSPISERFGAPVALENDADAAALGESWVGAGRGLSSLYMVTIGTGVGTGLILNGEIYRGVAGAHPEAGHIIIDPAGPEWYCGAHGCWESLVSGPAIVQFARSAPEILSSVLFDDCQGNLDQLDAVMVFRGARRDDLLCSRLVNQTANYIALGLVNIIMLYLPDVIVLTGGVLKSFDLLEDQIRSVVRRHDVIVPAHRVNIQLSNLGQQAGMFGAARAAQLLVLESKR